MYHCLGVKYIDRKKIHVNCSQVLELLHLITINLYEQDLHTHRL